MEASALRPGGLGAPHFGGLRRMASDERLVQLVRDGRADAYEAVFDRYQRPILSFCRHMLGTREEAEDAVQQTFLAAYNDMVRSDKSILLRPWLYTIARNQCLSILRARRETTSLDDVQPAVDGLAAEVQRRADLQDLLRDLAELPVDQRAALVLAELGALSHDEIADVVGCPKEKVKALVFQARSSLSASREARDTPCEEIREQLSMLSGGSLRRNTLRRHLRECDGCRAFRDEVKRQRAAMALVLPVVPTAGLKAGVLSAIGVSGAGGGAATGAALGAGAGGGTVAASGGGVAALVANAGIGKVVAAAAIAAGGLGGGVAAVKAVDERSSTTTPTVAPASSNTPEKTREALTGKSSPTALTPSGVRPTRAGGAHAPGKQSGGVANGKSAKGERGRSQTAPGRSRTSPGRAGTSPGLAGTTPGKSGTAPGQIQPKINSGRSESAPGRAIAPSGGGGGGYSGGGSRSSGGGSGGAGTPQGGGGGAGGSAVESLPLGG